MKTYKLKADQEKRYAKIQEGVEIWSECLNELIRREEKTKPEAIPGYEQILRDLIERGRHFVAVTYTPGFIDVRTAELAASTQHILTEKLKEFEHNKDGHGR